LGKKFAAFFKVYQKFCLKHKTSNETEAAAGDTDEVETDVMDNLVQHAESEKYLKRFYNDHAATFKTE